ncbi:hypothetical protein D9M71_779660 [compost metagenome]
MERLADQFGNSAGVVYLHDPFRQGAKHLAKINFLKGFAILLIASNLANEQNHRR